MAFKQFITKPASWGYSFLTLIILVVVVIGAVDHVVTYQTTAKTYNDVTLIPHRKVGLLLGCSKYATGGRISKFYSNRIDAAVELFKARKIDYILASGDNRTLQYNEPQWMHDDLVARGIPSQKIFLDYAGLRTLDSVVRCSRVFGENKITVISQQFHNQRAIFIANHWNIDAIGYNAKDVDGSLGFQVLLREKLARVAMIIDLCTGKEPRYYGNKVVIK